MLRALSAEVFDGFGPCALGPVTDTVVEHALPSAPHESRSLLRAHCPRRPGIYGMIDGRGELIYVGKAKSLRDRLQSYFRPTADPRARKIIARTARLVWEPVTHEFVALLRELELIRRWRPRLNVQGQPGRLGRAFVRLGRGPAASVSMTSVPARRGETSFGPFRAGRRLREAVRRVNHVFRLRDCPERVPVAFADERELFPQQRDAQCLRYELGTCLAPCAAACSASAYAAQVEAARRFLSGTDVTLLSRLEEAMRAAAGEREFERAVVARDALAELSWLHGQLQAVRDTRRRCSFVYLLADGEGEEWWCLLHRGQVRGIIPAPTREFAAETWNLLETVYSNSRPSIREQLAEDLDVLLLTATWFRQKPEELHRKLLPEQARPVCRSLMSADHPLQSDDRDAA